MNCIIIDDEPKALDIIEDYAKKTPFLKVGGKFRDAIEAIAFLDNESADLIFLDINMPDMSGLQFLNSLQSRPLVIFTTAYSEYAVESYEYDAVDYLLKPIRFERFLTAAQKANEKYRQLKESPDIGPGSTEELIILKSGTEFHQVKKKEILYIEGARNYALFITAVKKIPVLLSMKEAEKKLSTDRFIRVHKSFIVSTDNVDVFERDIIRIGKVKIPLGEAYRENVRAFLENRV